MRRWRALLSDLIGRERATVPSTPELDPFERPDDTPTAPDALSSALEEIEAAALEVYAVAGLPTRPGHYRRGPRAANWSFLAADLKPEERFALTLNHPSEKGWRFARLQDLGARSEREDLRAASRLLNEIAEMRAAQRGVLTRDHLLTAMELGGAWRALRDAQAMRTSRLTLTAPASAPRKPRAKRDKSSKPR